MIKLKTIDIEIAIANYFNIRKNLIVPNISWGLDIHECDLLMISKCGYATEIEIKISKSDLIKDKLKSHKHISKKIKNLYFAIPEYLLEFKEHAPERSGIIVVDNDGWCQVVRKPVPSSKPYKFTDKERYNVARLGAMRIWGLKRKIRNLNNSITMKSGAIN